MTLVYERLSAALANRYRIERELGAGGMATVFLAEDIKHKRRVAVKVLKPELAAVLGAERFVQEITTTAALQHPHILPLFDSGEADGFLFYVMPFIDGETLRDKLNRETQFGVDEAVKIAGEVADALHYAHSQGVIHRDIKPENILLANGRPMVADFGIALAVSAAAGGRMTETGLSLGTPHYMSPEQATAEKDISARSDVYSLASVLYEMLAGQPPHLGGSAQQIIMKIIAEPCEPVTRHRKSVPLNVAAALAKALEKLPADRFESAARFAEALNNPLFSSGTTSLMSGVTYGADSRWKAAALALGVIVVALLAWQSIRPLGNAGPSAYDVALPDSAPLNRRLTPSFAVSADGDFVVYAGGNPGALWYRSLHDATIRRIDGTEGGLLPAISADGRQVAFVRGGSADNTTEATVEMVSVDGGTATVIGRSRAANALEWLADGRLLVTEGDALRAQTFNTAGGRSTVASLRYCVDPAPISGGPLLICGGGGDMLASWSDLSDSASGGRFRSVDRDSGLVFGSTFRIVDDKYVIWLSTRGDLLAASVDLERRRIGRPVRMLTGLARGAYFGAGAYALSASGTLVYATGSNEAVSYLVRADARTLDTLRVGREPFLQFAMSPDGRRLAAVVQRLDDQELRLYDLRSGEHIVWMTRPRIRHPLWSTRGDRLMVSTTDSIFVGPPDGTAPPRLLMPIVNFETFAWQADGRVVATLWDKSLVVTINPDEQPQLFDTIATTAVMGRPSPDGRWLAYNTPDFRSLWLEPSPRTGERYPVPLGDYPQWLSSSEFVTSRDDGRFSRTTVDASVRPPALANRVWFTATNFVGNASGGFALTPDGKAIYKQGADIVPVRYLRVLPNWVTQMKRAVDEARR